THPLRLATRCHEIPCALDLDGIHWHLLHLPSLPPAHGQHLRATHAEAQLGQDNDERIDHARCHDIRLLIVCHGCSLLAAAMRVSHATPSTASCTKHTPAPRSGACGTALRLPLKRVCCTRHSPTRTLASWEVVPPAAAWAPAVLYWAIVDIGGIY